MDRPVARPDQVTLGVLISQVSREEADAAVAVCGVGEKRSDGKLPAHMTTSRCVDDVNLAAKKLRSDR